MDPDGSGADRVARSVDAIDPSRSISHWKRTTHNAKLPSRAVHLSHLATHHVQPTCAPAADSTPPFSCHRKNTIEMIV